MFALFQTEFSALIVLGLMGFGPLPRWLLGALACWPGCLDVATRDYMRQNPDGVKGLRLFFAFARERAATKRISVRPERLSFSRLTEKLSCFHFGEEDHCYCFIPMSVPPFFPIFAICYLCRTPRK